jgi:hypothetical protein
MSKDVANYIWKLALKAEEDEKALTLQKCYVDRQYLSTCRKKMWRQKIYDKVFSHLDAEDCIFDFIHVWDIKKSQPQQNERCYEFTYNNVHQYYISNDQDVIILDTLGSFNLKWKFLYGFYRNSYQWILQISWKHWDETLKNDQSGELF